MSTEAKIKHTAIQADALAAALERNQQLIEMLLAASKELDRNRRLLEAGERLAELLRPAADIIETVDNRCSAADGPVTPTEREITQDELRRFLRVTWAACEHARSPLAAYQEAAK